MTEGARVRVKYNRYEAVGTIVGEAGPWYLVEPDEKPTVQDLFRAIAPQIKNQTEAVENLKSLLHELECLGPRGTARCVPTGWRDLLLLETPKGMPVAWEEMAFEGGKPVHGGMWAGSIEEADGDYILLKLPEPLSALEGLDLPRTVTLATLKPKLFDSEVTEISRELHGRWKRSGAAVPSGRFRKGRTTHTFHWSSWATFVPFVDKGPKPYETEAYVLDQPMAVEDLFMLCSSQGVDALECVRHGARLDMLPVLMTSEPGWERALRPSPL